jgi:thiol:disulfide interchange protein
MKTALILAALAMSCTLNAAEWLTNLDQAMATAKHQNKPILIDFTGSDWCPWCVKLKQEVFDTPEFQSWAASNVILLEIDFPRNTPQDPATQAANQALARKLGVDGFPTVVLFTPEGMEKGRLGYQRGGAKAFIRSAELILK